MSATDLLLSWYAVAGRTTLPWRQTRDPYAIVVSEFMLQQTQVERVIPLYEMFVERWPSFAELARASAGDVVRAWRGLGYNSRAVRLRLLALAVLERHGGVLPRERERLLELPGIGAYTAAAISAFAFDDDVAAMDTNVRRVVHRLALGLEHPPLATDEAIGRIAVTMIPHGRAHDWNSSVMDLGSSVCTARAPKCLICPLRTACKAAPIDRAALHAQANRHAKPRSPQSAIRFEESARFLRGRIIDRLRNLEPDEAISVEQLQNDLAPIVAVHRLGDLPGTLAALQRDGLVHLGGERVRLA